MKAVGRTMLAMLAIASTGCLGLNRDRPTLQSQVDEVAPEVVLPRASFDMACDRDSLAMTRLADYQYGVAGCGKRAVYVLRCTADVRSGDVRPENCTPLRNGEITTDVESAPAGSEATATP